MNQKKHVQKAQALARGGGDTLSEHPRTAATDAGETSTLSDSLDTLGVSVDRILTEKAVLLRAAYAAYHALQSYQYGNSAPDLAAECCEVLLDAIAKAEGR